MFDDMMIVDVPGPLSYISLCLAKFCCPNLWSELNGPLPFAWNGLWHREAQKAVRAKPEISKATSSHIPQAQCPPHKLRNYTILGRDYINCSMEPRGGHTFGLEPGPVPPPLFHTKC